MKCERGPCKNRDKRIHFLLSTFLSILRRENNNNLPRSNRLPWDYQCMRLVDLYYYNVNYAKIFFFVLNRTTLIFIYPFNELYLLRDEFYFWWLKQERWNSKYESVVEKMLILFHFTSWSIEKISREDALEQHTSMTFSNRCHDFYMSLLTSTSNVRIFRLTSLIDDGLYLFVRFFLFNCHRVFNRIIK